VRAADEWRKRPRFAARTSESPIRNDAIRCEIARALYGLPFLLFAFLLARARAGARFPGYTLAYTSAY